MRKFKCNLDNFELEADFHNEGIRVFQIFPENTIYKGEKVYRGMLHMHTKTLILFQNVHNNYSFVTSDEFKLSNSELYLYNFTIILDDEVIEYLESLLIMNTLAGE